VTKRVGFTNTFLGLILKYCLKKIKNKKILPEEVAFSLAIWG
jgi:hypothetical protein